MMTEEATASKDPTFGALGLSGPILKTLDDIGYESPTPIQARTIPLVLAGRDVLGQAQTGTGKTAAFALPLLSRIDLKLSAVQVLVLVPTRELAIQVAEAFQGYAARLKPFHVIPIYGGQDYGIQFRALERGVQVVVGTPGRVMDHMRRKSLRLDRLMCLVLDEADEMLRMGFIDDVKWVLEQMPKQCQIALFSATMPASIRQIAQKHLKEPEVIMVEQHAASPETINQRYWLVAGPHKIDALTRILEAESFDAVLIFVRTKGETAELAEKLSARGYAAAHLSGDVAQAQRERTVNGLRKGKVNIIVATDVAARGLDVERISHVINYDIPYDPGTYVHRIGRTGRAGRRGEAILFVAPRERHMLRAIETTTRKRIPLMTLPSTEMINDRRVARFKQRITDTRDRGDLALFETIIEQYQQEHNVPAVEIAAALARIIQGDQPMLLAPEQHAPPVIAETPEPSAFRQRDRHRGRDRDEAGGMESYRIEVGRADGVKPGNIVGAIANEVGLESRRMGHIDIRDKYTLIDLPVGMPDRVLRHMERVRVAGKPMRIRRASEGAEQQSFAPGHPRRPPKQDVKSSAKKRKKAELA